MRLSAIGIGTGVLGAALCGAAVLAVLGPAREQAAVVRPAGLDDTVTAAIPDPENVLRPRRDAADTAQLAAGLDAVFSGDVATARRIRASIPDTLDRRILVWAVALWGGGATTSAEIAEAGRTLIGWPGLATLRRNSERALYREKPAPETVVRAFGGSEPQTPEGAILLARAQLALGREDLARVALSKFWRKARLEPWQENAVLREFGTVIPAADHRVRMEAMLYLERVRSAGRVAKLAGAEELWKAWAAAIRNQKDAAALLEKVPEAQRTAGWYFIRARQFRRAGQFAEAAAVMEKAPVEAAALVDPDAWWIERRVLSRELLDAGDAKAAYAIAAGHAAEEPANIADAEFHAGWYALRHLGQPEVAARHFARIVQVAEGPISLSRAYYWLGRAAEAGAQGDATAYFEKAAAFGTCFYGQLAAQRLGRAAIPVAAPVPSLADRDNFERREAVAAIRRLEAAGYTPRADVLYRELARQLTSRGELALLAGMAEARGDHTLALRVGKIASARGIDVGALAHPVGAIPLTAKIDSAGKALAYAVARQESEFNASAVSGAGAMGLLQLLPSTAREMAERTGLPFSKARLTEDAGYNATLGAAFLSQQLGRFDGSYVLTIAGYNAGPRRAAEWAKRYGDPRGKDLDTVVDWIERIPFTETRSYVQRVMENYQTYKMRLSGEFAIADDLVRGR